jgi:hypothetical protein
MMLVGGISKALITTAAGLVIAIPTLGFYSYFRGIVQDIVDIVDDYSTDIVKLIEEASPLVPPMTTRVPSSSQQPFMQQPLPSSSPKEIEPQEVFSHA